MSSLRQSKGFQKYLANTSWMMGGRIFRMGIAFLVGVYVVRYLGPERYGILSYAVSFVWLFTALATLGLDQIVIRELVKHPDQRDRLLGTAFVLKVGGTGLMGAGIILGLQVLENDSVTQLLIGIISLGVFFQAWNVIDFYFQSQVQSRYVIIAQTVQVIVSASIKLGLIFIEASLPYFALVFVIEAAILAAFLIGAYRLRTGWVRITAFRWEKAKYLLKNSWMLMLSGVVILVYMKIDQIMIKELLDSEAVGVYASAVKLSEAWYFIPTAIATSLFPSIIATRQNDKALYNDRIQKLYDLMVFSAVAIALPTTFLAHEVILLLYGAPFQEASTVLKIHIWSGVFVFLGAASNRWLLSENLQIFSTINTSIGAVINVILNYILIPEFGIEGAAWATLISQFTASYLGLLFFSKTRVNFIHLTKSLFFVRLLTLKVKR